jgi:hypothetical protein
MRKLFTTFCLVFTLISGSLVFADSIDANILGAGNLSCRVVLKNTEDKGLRKFYENWAQGWISATNHFTDTIRVGMTHREGKGVWEDHPLPANVKPRRDVIWYKILSYCSEEPKAFLSDAVKDLMKSRWKKAVDK